MKLWATFFKFQYYSCKNHQKIINRGTWGKRKNEEQKELGEQENRGTWGTGAIGQQRDGSKEEQGTRAIRGGEEQGEQGEKGEQGKKRMGEEGERGIKGTG